MKRGVKIKRLFIFNETNRANTLTQMRLQNGLGIDQSMVEEDSREKDFLLQDDELLV